VPMANLPFLSSKSRFSEERDWIDNHDTIESKDSIRISNS
jgi:hypothetical protein